jgi:hypothetical protein
MPATLLSSTPLRRRLNAIMASWQRLIEIAGDRYRPELHYMRGPGPRWHAKHPLRPCALAGGNARGGPETPDKPARKLVCLAAL